ncbi:hypothetical protein [Algoriphagus vanfongensis]|uniref:hypothetical protein n=1 Tax=Algoriphagus vanfongensis TaxID=426371 RepID=UPI000685393E|nr:hypothetical protein [Algoriphagus vanfongensis]
MKFLGIYGEKCNRILFFIARYVEELLKFVIIIGFMILSGACSDDSIPDCGCESEGVYSIPNQEFEDVYGITIKEQMTGELFYKHPELVDEFFDYDEYNNRFWIVQLTPNCGNCRRVFIVCNESEIGEEYERLKKKGVYDSVRVQFSGEVKRPCRIGHLPADMAYGRIQLNYLKNQ